MQTPLRVLGTFALTVSIVACGGGGSDAPGTTGPSTVLSVGGTYPTRATLIADRNTCGSVTVQDNPTVVTHAAGSAEISLAHAGSTYRGVIETNGRFTSPPANFSFPDADYTIGVTGQFSTTGFTATVDLTKRTAAVTCTYAVAWVGTKSGNPNTIPN